MSKRSGFFVAIEGIDGSGKTTQIPLVAAKLEEAGYQVHITTEPSSGPLGSTLRKYLSNPHSHTAVDALLFAADRVEHYFDEILPQLESGKIVITDRYKLSSIVYQGLSGISDAWLIQINSQVPDPDLTILLDVPVEEAVERLGSAERTHLEKFEKNNLLNKLVDRYKSISVTQRISIDASQSITKVTEAMTSAILTYMG